MNLNDHPTPMAKAISRFTPKVNFPPNGDSLYFPVAFESRYTRQTRNDDPHICSSTLSCSVSNSRPLTAATQRHALPRSPDPLHSLCSREQLTVRESDYHSQHDATCRKAGLRIESEETILLRVNLVAGVLQSFNRFILSRVTWLSLHGAIVFVILSV